MDDRNADKPRLVGINHVALEVGDIEEALAFYGAIFDFPLHGRHDRMAFLDMGDQFLTLTETKAAKERGPDHRPHAHFGLVVDDRAQVRALAEEADARMVEGPFLDFLDPWSNRIEVIDYARIECTKAPHVAAGIGLGLLRKSEEALKELAEKGMAP